MGQNYIAVLAPTSIAIPQAQEERLLQIDHVLGDFRSQVCRIDVGDTNKAIIQVRAMRALRQLIDENIMDDVMELMNTQQGFKTDRNPTVFRDGKRVTPYDRETVKNCLMVALLSGAKVIGNQFNIIAGQCYLTKEFSHSAILRFPGLTDFVYQIGDIARFGEKAAKVEGYASYFVNGKSYEVVCRKTDVMDLRLVVNCYSNSSPDEVRGRAEAKLFRQILSRLTGLNLDHDEGGSEPEFAPPAQSAKADAKADVIDGQATVVPADPASVPETSGIQAHAKGAQAFVDQFAQELSQCTMLSQVQRLMADREKMVDQSDWSDTLKQDTINVLIEHAQEAGERIRSSRGEASNR